MLDSVREAVFNRLRPWFADPGGSVEHSGPRVLDLFAGTGSLGIEALSRGASRARFVEEGGRARGVLGDNLAAGGLERRAELPAGDAFDPRTHEPVHPGGPAGACVEGSAGPWDLVFLDPPYPIVRERPGRARVLELVRALLLGHDGAPAVVAPDGVAVLHVPTGTLLDPELPPELEVARRDYGTSAILWLGRPEPAP